MKKIYIAILIIVCTYNSYAQESSLKEVITTLNKELYIVEVGTNERVNKYNIADSVNKVDFIYSNLDYNPNIVDADNPNLIISELESGMFKVDIVFDSLPYYNIYELCSYPLILKKQDSIMIGYIIDSMQDVYKGYALYFDLKEKINLFLYSGNNGCWSSSLYKGSNNNKPFIYQFEDDEPTNCNKEYVRYGLSITRFDMNLILCNEYIFFNDSLNIINNFTFDYRDSNNTDGFFVSYGIFSRKLAVYPKYQRLIVKRSLGDVLISDLYTKSERYIGFLDYISLVKIDRSEFHLFNRLKFFRRKNYIHLWWLD